MAEAAATYPAGMSVTRTTAPQAMPYAYALALMGAQDKYRTDMARSYAPIQAPAPILGRTPATPILGAMRAEPYRTTPAPVQKSPLERARERAELMKAQAMTRGPRMYYTQGGFNNPQHLEMDVEHMSPIERQLFLPQNSGFMKEDDNQSPDDRALMRAMQLLRARYGDGR